MQGLALNALGDIGRLGPRLYSQEASHLGVKADLQSSGDMRGHGHH